ncbi:MAG: hypothetical protein KatS3mg034_0660 [Vicingaceae bacterium]|nr:MAG: hypothetical protein KatS3mg034_0660 [Vicingaceae bacterium]
MSEYLSKISLPTADIFIDAEDFLWIKWKENAEFTLEMAKKHESAIVEISQGKKRLFILDVRVNYSYVDPEARRYMAKSEPVNQLRHAQAILSNSLGARLMMNFYMKIDKPPVPMKLFSNEDAAKKWLKQFLPNP